MLHARSHSLVIIVSRHNKWVAGVCNHQRQRENERHLSSSPDSFYFKKNGQVSRCKINSSSSFFASGPCCPAFSSLEESTVCFYPGLCTKTTKMHVQSSFCRCWGGGGRDMIENFQSWLGSLSNCQSSVRQQLSLLLISVIIVTQ